MHQEIRRGLYGLVFAAGLAALGSSEASAAETSGQSGLAGGNQIAPVLIAPVTVQGNPITLIGDPTTSTGTSGTGGTATPEGTTPAHVGARTDQDTPGSNGQDPSGTPAGVPADGGSTSGTHGMAPVGGGSASAGLVSGSTPPTVSGADGARSDDRTPSAATASTAPADHAGTVGARATGGDVRGPAAGTGGAHDCLTPGAPADGAATGFADDSSATGTAPTGSAGCGDSRAPRRPGVES